MRSSKLFLDSLSRLESKFSNLAPELELTVRDPELDLEGYLVIWSTLAAKGGPLGRIGKGGTRVSPTVSLSEVGELARTMTLKNAAAGLKLGGAKSGIKADPNDPALEKKFRRFAQLLKFLLSEHGGPFGGFGFDVGARAEYVGWVCDELKSTRAFTGKPLELGGTDYDREGIAGLGVVCAAETYLNSLQQSLAGKTISIQGAGAMGAAVLRYAIENGAVLKAIADPRIGGAYLLKGSISSALVKALSKQEFETAKKLLKQEAILLPDLGGILYLDVDILFPCALQNVIHEKNVKKVKAKLIVEGANNPCTEVARELLHARGSFLIPDFIANPGGIIAAYVEMLYTTSHADNVKFRTKPEKAKQLTREKVSANVLEICKLVQKYGVTPVQAARFRALNSIFKSEDGLH